jgi:hypothetical protein
MTRIRAPWGALMVSIVVGLVIIAPQLIFIQHLGSAYQGIYMHNTDAEPHYLARMEEAVKGEGIGNPFIVEFRNTVPPSFFSYSEELLAIPARITPLSVPVLNLLYKFLLPALLAFVMYTLVVALTSSRAWAGVSAIALVLGVTTFNLGTFLNLLQGRLVYEQFLLYSRPVSPVLYVLFLLGYLHLLFVRPYSRTRLLLLGLLYGLSWYLFIYLSTFLTALLGSLVLWHLLKRDIASARRYAAVAIAGFIPAIPAVMNLHAITQSPYYGLFVGPIGLEHTHAPYLHIPLLIIALVVGWYSYRHRPYRYLKETFVLLATSLVVMNQQVLTGLSLHPAHYITYFCMPVYVLVMILLLSSWLKTHTGLRGVLQVAIVLYAVVASAFILYSSYARWAPVVVTEQRYAPVLAWLDMHSPTDSVVMANPVLSELIPAYTADNVMWEVHANAYLMPQSRWDFTPDNALTAPDFCTFISQYRLDYVVQDAADPAWSSLGSKTCLRPAAEMGGFTIYEIRK